MIPKLPVAVLVLYQPGFRFKFKKYYLQKGNNMVGSHVQANVRIQDGPQKVANIQITQDLAIIQPIVEDGVFVMSNIKKKTPTKLRIGMSYVIEMEKDFSIGQRKALMQIMGVQDLLRVQNVQNKHMFESKVAQPLNNSQHSNKTQQLKSNNEQFQPTLLINNNQAFESTLPLNDNECFDATLPLNNNQLFQATLPVDDNQYFQPTIPVDHFMEYRASEKVQQRQLPINISSLSVNNSSIRQDFKEPQNNRLSNAIVDENQNFSMPDTISQNDMPGTIQDGMPDTIQQDNIFQVSNSRPRILRTMTLKKSQTQLKRKQFQSLNEKPIKQIQDFDDLFGSHPVSDPPMKLSLQMGGSVLSNEGQKKVMKKQSKNSQIAQMDQEQSGGTQKISEMSQNNGLKKVGVFNCKKNDINEKQLKKKGYKVVDHPDQPFQLLLVGPGQLKRSTKLFKALMDGMQIKSTGWITNKKAKITGKLQGFSWESIQKRKGQKGKIFSGNYYLQPQLRDQFDEVMRYGGATMVEEVGKNKAKSSISIVLDEKHPIGKEIFDERKNYKKWEFYSYRMIIESILMGQQINKKYAVDEYSF